MGTSAAGRSQAPQRACSWYAVMPMTGRMTRGVQLHLHLHLHPSPALEEALALVAGHGAIEELLLRPGVVEVVVDHLVAECASSDRARLERRDRLAQRVREARRVGL